MKIVYDCQQLAKQMTGVGYYTAHLLREMLALQPSHEFLLLCHTGNADVVRDTIQSSSSAHLVVLDNPVSLDYRVQQQMLSELLPKQKAELYYSPCFMSVSPAVCRTVSVIHDATFVLYPEFHPRGGAEYLHRLVNDTCLNAERIITMSENSRRDIARFYHYPEERIDVVPLAADDEFLHPVSATKKNSVLEALSLGTEYILAVNMGNPKKNIDTLLKAYAKLDNRVRNKIPLVVAGECNPQTLDLAEMVKRYGIASQVKLTGWIDRESLRCLYAGASLFCFPSLHEGFGLPVIEAMASGVPVISSNAASLPEVGGNAACYVDPHDIHGWALQIERLLDSKEKRMEMVRLGKDRAETFTWKKTAQKTLQIIDSLQIPAATGTVTEDDRITLVALLGDEAEHVEPFLENLSDYVDEIIFVADGPQEKARLALEHCLNCQPDSRLKDKVKVVERLLDHDFSSQRNFGHDHARCPWVLHVDLDERFSANLLASLPALVHTLAASGKTVCGFRRMNYLHNVLVNDVPRQNWNEKWLQCQQASQPDRDADTQSVVNPDTQFRLMRRGIRWRNALHETPEPVGQLPREVTVSRKGAIVHAKTVSRQNRQDEFYESILPGGSLRGGRASAVQKDPVAGRRKAIAQKNGLKILMLASEYPPAKGFGLARYASGLATALSGLGHEVHVLSLNANGKVRSSQQDGVTVHLMDEDFPVKHYQWVGGAILNNPRVLAKGLLVAEELGGFDVVLSHDWLLGHAAKSLKEALRIPWCLMVHDTEVGKRDGKLTPNQAYIAEMEAWCLQHTDQVLVPGEFLRDELVRIFGIERQSIHVAGCGVDTERFQSETDIADFRSLFATKDEKLLVYAGRLSPMKGISDLLQAVGMLCHEQVPIRLVVAGDGVLAETLHRYCQEKGLQDRVYFTGTLDDKVLGALYKAADLVVMPSRYEPFGMVALEAASMGTRVLAANVGGLGQMLATSNGQIKGIEPGNPEVLASQIREQLSLPDDVCAQRIPQWIQAQYDWNQVAERVATKMDGLLPVQENEQ